MNMFEIKVPDIGDFKAVEVIELLVQPGDTVKVDQSLMTVESDKASMEIPSSHAGVVREWKVKIGDAVAEGSVMLVLDAADGAGGAKEPPAAPAAAPEPPLSAAPAPAATPVPVAAPAAAPEQASAPTRAHGAGAAHASPSIRKFARELGVDLAKLQGSGPKGRITRDDVQGFVKSALAAGPAAAPAAGGGTGLNLLPWPSLDFSKFGASETQPLSRIKKISGPNLHRNWVVIPHVTVFEEADVTGLEALRVESNAAYARAGSPVKLTMLAFVIKASVAALQKFPNFNASLDEANGQLILKKYHHIGFAADTPNGLVVPVVKDADKKSVSQIAAEMTALSAQAREGKLSPGNMQGATFTISSLGGIGGTGFTPIINAPEVAILGLAKSQMKPVWDGAAFQPRLILPLALSFDHRVIDGAAAARFNAYLADVLADLRKTLL